MVFYHLTRLAAGDLVEIGNYIAKDNRQAAARTVATIARKFEFLAEHPRVHPADPNFRNLCKSKVGNYLILYRPAEGEIEIIRVLHSARDIETILKKMS